MTDATFTLAVTIPASAAIDADGIARSIAKALLAQAAQQVGDSRRDRGELTHHVGRESRVLGTWIYTPPN